MPGIRQWIRGSLFVVLLLTLVRGALPCRVARFVVPAILRSASACRSCQVALLVTWDSMVIDTAQGTETTTFNIVRTEKKGLREFKKGDKVIWNIGRNGNTGDLYLLLGSEIDGELAWSPIAITSEKLFAYIIKAPAPEAANRLEFFLKFLEFPDEHISNDAYAEFSRAEFKDVAALAPKMDRSQLREWLSSNDPKMRVRLGLYGMMLGLSGDDDDAAFLEKLILKRPEPNQPRFGIDGMMAGFIMLRGQRGLDTLLAAKFDDPQADGDLPLLKNALVFLWDFCQDRIPAKSLVVAMRRMLDSPWAFGVLENLARWKDWDSLDRLVAGYGKAPFDSNLEKEQIVQFALVCEKDGRKKSPDALPPSAVKARKFLKTLDPEFVKSAERSLGGPRRPANDPKSATSPNRSVDQTGSTSR